MTDFRAAWLEARDRRTEDQVAWLANFEVEQQWKEPHHLALPGLSSQVPYHHALSEMALLLAEPQDLVFLHQEPDVDFLAYLSSFGWRPPTMIAIHSGTESPNHRAEGFHHLLTDQLIQQWQASSSRASMQQRFQDWAHSGSRPGSLMVHGTSQLEEQLSRMLNLNMLSSSSDVVRAVNSKIFSRDRCLKHGIAQTEGRSVHHLSELEEAFRHLKPALVHHPLVLKDAYGVSGKGLFLIEDEPRFRQLQSKLMKQAERIGSDRMEMVLEVWVNKLKDLNVQFMVYPDGQTSPPIIQEALVVNGAHAGHVSAPHLSPLMHQQLEAAVRLLGVELADEGYVGPVGLDALMTIDNQLYPCIELNARFNMSTYHNRVRQKWMPADTICMTTACSFRRHKPVSFKQMKQLLGPLLLTPSSASGLLIVSFASVNSIYSRDEKQTRGKLYGVIAGNNRKHCEQIQQQVQNRLDALEANI
ncbi:ATP-binding protein [Marinicrinis sediminis]|uniref:ATP-grasp domain-containing protein n=1 Tax=Marinicrinis sediminis TaxID=1652465 RepID=A0ABW5RFW3_9BACL